MIFLWIHDFLQILSRFINFPTFLHVVILLTLSCIELLTFQFAWVIKLWSWHLQIQFIHILPTHSFEDEKQSFEDGRQSFVNEKQSFMTS